MMFAGKLPEYGSNHRGLLSPFLRPCLRFVARPEGLTTASFFLSVTICVHFPLTGKKACHTIWAYQHLSKPVKCCSLPLYRQRYLCALTMGPAQDNTFLSPLTESGATAAELCEVKPQAGDSELSSAQLLQEYTQLRERFLRTKNALASAAH